MSVLPSGWIEASLLELAGNSGLMVDGDWIESKDQDPKGDVRLIQLADIGDGHFVDKSRRFLTSERAAALKCTYLQPGDLLIARMPDPLGRACIFPDIGMPAVTAVDVCIWRSSLDGAAPSWLMHFVNSPEVRNLIQSQASGTTRQRVSGGNLKRTIVPVPPAPEQTRMVAKLESLRARSSRVRNELDIVPKLIEQYKQAILAKAFSGELTADFEAKTKWTTTTIDDISEVGTGATPKRGNPRYYQGGNIPWVTSGAVNKPIILQADQYITDAAIAETNCKIFPSGTILVAMYGEGKTRGMTSVLGIPAATNQALAAIQIKVEQVLPEYVRWLLISRYMALRDEAAGGVQPNLNLSIIKEVAIPLPGPREQLEIVRRITHSFDWLNKIEIEHSRAEYLLPKLDQAILAKAFCGELVPQDPRDEPASALLERIKAKHEKNGPARRGRARKA